MKNESISLFHFPEILKKTGEASTYIIRSNYIFEKCVVSTTFRWVRSQEKLQTEIRELILRGKPSKAPQFKVHVTEFENNF